MDRRTLGYSEEDVVLIYVGRLGPEKNLPFLLRSFAGTVQAFDHTRLLIIGDGPERDNLVDRTDHMEIKDAVRFTGMLSYEDVPSYLAMADAFVTASVTEVHPLSLIEAMAAGLPTLGISSPGISDTIQDGETGYLAPGEDLAGFTARMVKLVVDHEGRRRMGQNALRASQQYDIQHTTQEVLSRYQAVLADNARRPRGLRVRLRRFLDRLR
jgi:glycosyltransferase involved in cell wall biosynthesis